MKNLLKKKVTIMGDTFTIGEVILVVLFTIAFLLLLGLAEGLGNAIEGK